MDSKLLGGILLIIGTTVGGAMLALPMATSEIGFLNSIVFLITCWFIMMMNAFLILEVNLWFPANSNLISMAKATLGKWGQVLAWLSYLLLLYALLAAYMSGGGDFLRNLLATIHIKVSAECAALLFTSLFGVVVYRGIQSVDYLNRGLMFGKFGIYFLLVICLLPFISLPNLSGGELKYFTGSITVIVTSFGFAIIVPSLRTYFHDDITKLRKALLIGSVIPLICYLLWDVAIMGVIPRTGNNGLIAMLHSENSTSGFIIALSHLLQNRFITLFTGIFTAICLATAFLGVSLGLSDFLADGLNIAKKGKGNFIIYTATFLPPLLIALFYPGTFVTALSYAGVFCGVLLVLLPVLMAWSGRYYRKLAHGYQVIGGKYLLVILLMAAGLIIGNGIFVAV
jgi:tyrosine-specific transport protein